MEEFCGRSFLLCAAPEKEAKNKANGQQAIFVIITSMSSAALLRTAGENYLTVERMRKTCHFSWIHDTLMK